MLKLSPLRCSLLLVGSLVMAAQPARAITFDFSADALGYDPNDPQDEFLVGDSGGSTANITISNYNVGGFHPDPEGSSFSPFTVETLGIYLGAPEGAGGELGQNFSITFNTALLLTAYSITSPTANTRFNLYRCNNLECSTPTLVFYRNATAAGTFNFDTSNGGQVFGGETFNFNPGQIAAIRVTTQDGEQLAEDAGKGFDVSGIEAVPFESDVLPLVGATILFGGGMWWKRRRGSVSLELENSSPDNSADN